MRVRTIGVVLVVLVAATGVATAHGNELDVHTQLSADGTVQVAHVTQLDSAHLVLYRMEGGSRGAIVGHRFLPREGALTEREFVSVQVEPAVWENVSDHIRLFAALHHDDGDAAFDPSDDQLLERNGEAIGHEFVVGKAEGNASVHAEDQTAATTITVDRVRLDADGYLVARSHDGAAVGISPLTAGSHENVTVELDPEFYNHHSESFELDLVLYHDDGDGRFDAASDTLVTAGDEHVGTHMVVTKSTETVATVTPESTPTATATSTPAADQEPTATETATDTSTTGGSGPGPGAVLTLVTLVVAASAAALWKRRT